MTNGESMPKTDVVVIGAGPGGYTAAFAAADRGRRVVLIDGRNQLGGVCLNRGCIPSKTLLHVARLIHEARDAEAWGVSFGPPAIDLDGLRQWKDSIIARSNTGLRQLAKDRNVEVVRAWARFVDATTLALSTTRGGEPDLGHLAFDQAVIATGSRPARIASLDLGGPRVMDSTAALALPGIPSSLLVVGGGYIGLELGSVYAALGSEVSVVEMTDGLLPGIDRDLVRILQARLRKTFKRILVGTKILDAAPSDDAVTVTLGDGADHTSRHTFERVLVAVGRTANTDGLGLENTQVRLADAGTVEVDAHQRTADDHILAVGDVAGQPMLAHKASAEAKIAAAVLAGEPPSCRAAAIPAVVFTDPEIAWVGLTETQAAVEGIPIEVAKFPWGASGRAAAMGRNDGLTKIITEPTTRRVLGVGIVGVGAGGLIAEPTFAIEMKATAEDLARTIHPHPTLSETMGEAADVSLGAATHIRRPRR